MLRSRRRGAKGDRRRPVSMRLNHVRRGHLFGMPFSQRQAGVDQHAVAVLHQPAPDEAALPLPLHQKPLRANRIKRLQLHRPQQPPARSTAVQSANRARQTRAPASTAPHTRPDRSQRMITPHPRPQVNVAEQFARSIVATAHARLGIVGGNESRSPAGTPFSTAC